MPASRTSRRPTAFGRVVLLTGGAEFLAERAVARVLAGVRAEAPEADVAEVVGGSLGAGELATLTSPSLFSTASGVVVRELQDLGDDAQADLLAYAADPSPDVACVLLHPGGSKGTGLLGRLRKLDAVDEDKHVAPKAWELDRWVAAEVQGLGGSIDPAAAAFLVAAVGHDLRSLAAACSQLVEEIAPSAGVTRLDTALLRQYFEGRAEVRSFDIADAAVEGRLPDAMEQLRWALGNQVASVLVTSAFGSGLRALALLQSATRGLSEADLAREVGVPPFRVKTLRRQARGWDAAGLSSALRAVARADLDVKGGAGDPAYALERLVLSVHRARLRG